MSEDLFEHIAEHRQRSALLCLRGAAKAWPVILVVSIHRAPLPAHNPSSHHTTIANA